MSDQVSLAQILANLSEEEREAALAELSPAALARLKYDWKFWARPNQLEPEGNWTTWLILVDEGSVRRARGLRLSANGCVATLRSLPGVATKLHSWQRQPPMRETLWSKGRQAF